MKSCLTGLAGLLLAATPLSAQFTGSDDFAGETKNATKWGADISGGSGLLTQADGVVRYTSASPTDDDYMAWPWILGTGPLDQNWSIQADVHVPIIALPEGFADASYRPADILLRAWSQGNFRPGKTISWE